MGQFSVSVISHFQFSNGHYQASEMMVLERRKQNAFKGMKTKRPGLMHEGGKQFRKNISIACLQNYSLEHYLGAQGHI